MNWRSFFSTPAAPRAAVIVLPPTNAAPDWTETQRVEWSRFAESDTGRQLLARCAAVEYMALQAAAETALPEDLQRAAGWRRCRLWLESLSRPASARTAEANDKPRPGDPDALEQFTP